MGAYSRRDIQKAVGADSRRDIQNVAAAVRLLSLLYISLKWFGLSYEVLDGILYLLSLL